MLMKVRRHDTLTCTQMYPQAVSRRALNGSERAAQHQVHKGKQLVATVAPRWQRKAVALVSLSRNPAITCLIGSSVSRQVP